MSEIVHESSRMPSVAVAMSGGVDSAVAALLLKRQGYDVTGIHLKLFDAPDDDPCFRSCCSIESAERARAVCDRIGARFYVLNYREKFLEHVIQPFAKAYIAGLTPNPCIACNRWIKFEFLLNQMRSVDVDFLATGHYIRKIRENDEWFLLRGVDTSKDQSYFLYMLTQSTLDYLLFPNGDYEKSEIRRIASHAGLPVADTPESQEICFTLSDSYASLIESMFPGIVREGPIVDSSGREIGRHKGIVRYTVGQRHGLGISSPVPLYVLEIRPESNTIIVGPREETYSDSLVFSDASWVSGSPPPDGSIADVQIRYNAKPAKARFEILNTDLHSVNFETPQLSVTPGQAVVMWTDDKLIGGGIIRK